MRPMPEGRLADPDCTLGTDPRSDPRMIAALAPFGLDGLLPLPPVTPDSPLPDRVAYVTEAEEVLVDVLDALARIAPVAEAVTNETTTIRGDDGNDITLYISRPSGTTAVAPCIFHIHGGGMAFGSATDIGYVRWRDNLAATGLVVVGVEFRNSAGELGPHPYPAGLNDCAAGLRWTAAHLGDLGASHIVVSGESGGGNLTLGRCSQGQARSLAARNRRGLRAMPVHFEPLPRTARRPAVPEGERRLHLQLPWRWPSSVRSTTLTANTAATPHVGPEMRPRPTLRACRRT